MLTGGVCGRKIDYLSRDDGFDAARDASQTKDLTSKVRRDMPVLEHRKRV